MLKLLAGVALLGQDASRGRVAGLIGAATAAYAVQTGLAYALWELFSSSRPRRRSHQGYRVRSAGEIIRASFDGTIHGPRDGGRPTAPTFYYYACATLYRTRSSGSRSRPPQNS